MCCIINKSDVLSEVRIVVLLYSNFVINKNDVKYKHNIKKQIRNILIVLDKGLLWLLPRDCGDTELALALMRNTFTPNDY